MVKCTCDGETWKLSSSLFSLLMLVLLFVFPRRSILKVKRFHPIFTVKIWQPPLLFSFTINLTDCIYLYIYSVDY